MQNKNNKNFASANTDKCYLKRKSFQSTVTVIFYHFHKFTRRYIQSIRDSKECFKRRPAYSAFDCA